MDFNELGVILRGLGVPDSVASVGKYADDHYCLVPTDEGKYEVFWYERGGKYDFCVYDSESAGCFGFLGLIGGGLSGIQPVLRGQGVRNALGGASIAQPSVRSLIDGDEGTVFGGLSEQEWIERFVVPEDHGLPIGQRRLIWPDGRQHPDGFASPTDRAPARLEPGRLMDSFGPTFTRLLYDLGTPFGTRSLPLDYAQSGYRRWRVLKPTAVWVGPTAPWFGRPGGGKQYFTLMPAADLVGAGFIEEMDK